MSDSCSCSCSCGMASSDPKTYAGEVCEALMKTDFDLLEKIANRILTTKTAGNTIFTAGNGGSASTASHIINDLTKGCRLNQREGIRTVCLNDSSVLVTCLANDYSYEDIYAILLKTLANPGDVLIVFSGSGNSPNIVRACEMAREMGVFVIGFGGRDGGRMKPLCDICLLAPTNSMEQLEDLHVVYFHSLVCALKKKLEKMWDIEVFHFPKSAVKIVWNDEVKNLVGAEALNAILTATGAEFVDHCEPDAIAFAASAGMVSAIKAKNAYAVGVTKDAAMREGMVQAGVDCVVPDFSNIKRLVKFLRRI